LKIFFSLLLFFSLFPTVGFSQEPSLSYYSKTLSIANNDLQELVNFSKEKQVPFEIVFNLLEVESGGVGFDHFAVGPQTRFGRAYGIAQFMENTAPWIAEMGNMEYNGRNDLFDAPYSIRLAIVYLHYLQYGGKGHSGFRDWHATLTAYNRGIQGLRNFERKNGTAVSAYSKKILDGTEIEKY